MGFLFVCFNFIFIFPLDMFLLFQSSFCVDSVAIYNLEERLCCLFFYASNP